MTLPPSIEIRRLTQADVEAYRRIRLSSLATDPDSFGSTYEDQAAEPLAFFADRIASAAIFAAVVAERLVGVVHFRRATGTKEAHKGMLQGFFVEPDARKRGIGSALVEAVVALARSEVEQLHLNVVQDNHAAVALYQRFGFTAYGVEPRALKTARGYADEVLMALLF